MEIAFKNFVWNAEKEIENINKHGIDFSAAALAFKDPKRKIFTDSRHSALEKRFWFFRK